MSKESKRFTIGSVPFDNPILDNKTGKLYEKIESKRGFTSVLRLLNDMDDRIEALEQEIEDLELEIKEQGARHDI